MFIAFWFGCHYYYWNHRWFFVAYLICGFITCSFACWSAERCETLKGARRSKESKAKLNDWKTWVESLSDLELLSYEELNCTDEQFQIISNNVWHRWKKTLD